MTGAFSGEVDAVARDASDRQQKMRPNQDSLPGFYRLARRARIASTNDEAKAMAEAGAAEGTLVRALEQTEGRGRLGRPWVSPPGNLYASLILRPAVPVAAAAQLGFAAALAVGDACLGFAPEAAIAFKWPNDVLLAGRKLAGILLESSCGASGELAWVVLGIGVNLVTYPANAAYPATALSATGAEAAPDTMLAALARSFLGWYEQWQGGRAFGRLREAWLGRAHGLGQRLLVRLPKCELSGTFAGLDADGALLLDTVSGRRRITAGEVFPAGS